LICLIIYTLETTALGQSTERATFNRSRRSRFLDS